MDFIVFAGLAGVFLLALIFSYDIICQWSRNLATRNHQLPTYMQVEPTRLHTARMVLPKFHEYNHGTSCQTKYSLNIIRYSAQMNGEDPEHLWAFMNPASMSTWEMSSGAREDTLDDFARSYNFCKITGFGD